MLAEASMMAKHRDLAKEEMRLKFEEMRLLQQKQRVQLDTEIAKSEAEEKVVQSLQKQMNNIATGSRAGWHRN